MLIIKVEGEQARDIIDSLGQLNSATVHTLRVAIDDGGVKFKVNEMSWSPPYGEASEH